MNLVNFKPIFTCLLLTITYCESAKLSDNTEYVLQGNAGGIVASFVDFNQDKLIDILVIGANGRNVDALYAQLEKPFNRETLVRNLSSGNQFISGVQSTDFDGDGENDLVLLLRKRNDKSSSVNIQIYWGVVGGSVASTSTELDVSFKDDPIIADLNGNAYPELFGEDSTGQRIAVEVNITHLKESPQNRTFVELEGLEPLDNPSAHALQPSQSSAFIDINSDLYADLVLTTVSGYEIYYNVEGNLKYNKTIPFPAKYDSSKMKQISIVDIAQTGRMSLLVPACDNDECTKSVVLLHNFYEADNVWHTILNNTASPIASQPWGFYEPTQSLWKLPITLRTGDYNMDGFVDAVMTVQTRPDNGDSTKISVLFVNKPCDKHFCSDVGRMLVPDPELQTSQISRIDDTILAGFFDIYDNGVLDLLVVSMTTKSGNAKKESYPVISAYKQTSTSDACFIKVQVTSGLCFNNCPHGAQPYGVNQYGATVKYKTTALDGGNQQAIAGQLSQSAHFSLQAPYALFGLGMTPNYVDNVYVGMPESEFAYKKNVARNNDWTQIIPNSQLMVIPYPINEPSNWVMILFLTPSALVYYTGAVLLGICGLVAIIAGVLHWRERREDAEEKRQESHKFHFDAM